MTTITPNILEALRSGAEEKFKEELNVNDDEKRAAYFSGIYMTCEFLVGIARDEECWFKPILHAMPKRTVDAINDLVKEQEG